MVILFSYELFVFYNKLLELTKAMYPEMTFICNIS